MVSPKYVCDVVCQGRIEARNVTFAYPSNPNKKVLDNLSFTVEVLAITLLFMVAIAVVCHLITGCVAAGWRRIWHHGRVRQRQKHIFQTIAPALRP